MKKYLLCIVPVICLITIVLSGCNTCIPTVPSESPGEIVSTTTTETSTAILIATPSPSPSPTPSPTPDDRAIVNQEVTDFLNQQGDFAPESMQNHLIEYRKEKN